MEWFKQKYREVKQVVKWHIELPTKPEVDKRKGIKG